MGAISEFDASAGAQTVLAPTEVVIGTLVAVQADQQVLVDYPENPLNRPVRAISTSFFDAQTVGRQVALLFADRDLSKPIIIGLIRSGYSNYASQIVRQVSPLGLKLENGNTVIDAAGQLVFRCGAASLNLTEQGRVIIRGTHIASYSTGMNRIRGALVEVN